MVKFLIVRFSSIGDIVLTTPVIRLLKEQVEGANIHYLTKKQYAGILQSHPHIDKVHLLRDDFSETVAELKDEMFDHIIDLHNSLRSRRLKNALPVYSQTFKKLNWEKWLLVNLKINKLPDIHIVERYAATVNIFGATLDGKGLDYYIAPEDEVKISDLPLPYPSGYVLFAIGAQHFTKRLPTAKIISICNKIKLPIILAGGSGDFKTGQEIAKASTATILNTCGKYSLSQSASLVQQAQAVITHDTGLMHIAAAFGKKIISVWGSTVPQFGMTPYLPNKASKIIEADVKCRPCSKIGFSQCPKKHFNCMQQINEQEIADAINLAQY